MKLEYSLNQSLSTEFFSIEDLDSLSGSTFYTKIKKTDYIKGNQENLNFYNWITLEKFGATDLGIQEDGESHKDFKERMKNGDGIQIVPPFIKQGS